MQRIRLKVLPNVVWLGLLGLLVASGARSAEQGGLAAALGSFVFVTPAQLAALYQQSKGKK